MINLKEKPMISTRISNDKFEHFNVRCGSASEEGGGSYFAESSLIDDNLNGNPRRLRSEERPGSSRRDDITVEKYVLV